MPRGRVIQWTVLRGEGRHDPDAAIPAAPKTAEVIRLWGEPWPAEKVKSRLVEAFKELPGRAILSHGNGRFRVEFGTHIEHADMLGFAEERLKFSDYRLLVQWAAFKSRCDRCAWLAWCEAIGKTSKRGGEQVTRIAAKLGRHIANCDDERARRLSRRLLLDPPLDNAET